MSKKLHNITSKTDWDWIMSRKTDDLPIPYDPTEDLYDPNDDQAVEAFFKSAKVSMPNLHMIKEIKKSA